MGEINLKDKIVTCAYNMFAQRGIKSVTMDQISRELSMSKRTLYENFASKSELLSYVIVLMDKFCHKKIIEVMASAISPLEKFLKLITMISEMDTKDTLFFIDLVNNYSHLLDEFSKGNKENEYKVLMTLINEGRAYGSFHDDLNYEMLVHRHMNTRELIRKDMTISKEDLFEKHMVESIMFICCFATDKGMDELRVLCKKNNIKIFNI